MSCTRQPTAIRWDHCDFRNIRRLQVVLGKTANCCIVWCLAGACAHASHRQPDHMRCCTVPGGRGVLHCLASQPRYAPSLPHMLHLLSQMVSHCRRCSCNVPCHIGAPQRENFVADLQQATQADATLSDAVGSLTGLAAEFSAYRIKVVQAVHARGTVPVEVQHVPSTELSRHLEATVQHRCTATTLEAIISSTGTRLPGSTDELPQHLKGYQIQ